MYTYDEVAPTGNLNLKFRVGNDDVSGPDEPVVAYCFTEADAALICAALNAIDDIDRGRGAS